MRRVALVCIATILVGAGAGCGSTGTPAGGPQTTSSTTTPQPQTLLTVFRLVGGTLQAQQVSVPQTTEPATASLKALGFDATVTISGGTATVALASPSQSDVAEIVYTLTVFPTVQRVDVGGRTGVTRSDVAGYLPVISIESPSSGATVAKSFRVSGTASVFEATFVVELVVGGNVVEKQTVTASEGAPDRGTFETTLTAQSPGPAKVVAFAPSAADGSPQHQVDVAVTVTR